MNTSTIRIAENIELPYKCDLYVLEKIQEKYGTVLDFERQLIGKKIVQEKDENGDLIEKEVFTEPSISAVNFALPLMVKEGLEIEQISGDYPFKTDRQILSAATRNYRYIAYDLHNEFANCFKVKK